MSKARSTIILLAFQSLLSGCATSELWQEGTFRKAHFPAAPPELLLHYSAERQDVLAQYLERRQDSEVRIPRAFWLYENLESIRMRSHPQFVSPAAAAGLQAVPVYPSKQAAKAASPADLYGVLLDDQVQFELYSGERALGTFTLPSYRDPGGRLKQVLLTPFALVFDAATIAVVAVLVTSPYWIPALVQNTH
jgi:hypothetical protein